MVDGNGQGGSDRWWCCGTGVHQACKGVRRHADRTQKKVVCQALLPEYLSHKVTAEEITIDVTEYCDKKGVEHITDFAIGIDSDRVILEKNEVEFDFAVLSIGAKPNVFENTFGLGDIKSAENVRKKLESSERVVVVGSGATGVETACEVKEFYDCDVLLLEYFDRILPSFDQKVSNFVLGVLERDDIDVRVSHRVLGVEDRVITDKGEIDADLVISCMGIKPNPIGGVPTHKGWIKVDGFLRVRDNVFAIGDCAFVSVDGKIATKTALEAERQASHTAKNIRRLSRGEKLLRYDVKSSVDSPISFVTLAKKRAVLIYNRYFIPRPMFLLYAVKKAIVKAYLWRYRV